MSPPRTRSAGFRFAPDLEQLDDRDVPAVIAQTDFYKANAGQVLEIPAATGVLANDFSSLDAGAVLTATFTGATLFVADANGDNLSDPVAYPLPANSITLNPDGSFRFVVPSNLPVTIDGLNFTYTATNALNPNDPPASGLVNIELGQPTTPRFAVAPQAGAAPVVNVYEVGSGTLIQSFDAYERSFTGGVRVAVGDLNGDGVPDVATAPAEGGSARVKVFDGRTGRVLFDQVVFESAFNGGAFVAIGDVNGDSFDDLIVGAGVGGGPRVVVFNGQGFSPFLLTNNQNQNPFNPGPQILGGTFQYNGNSRLMDFFAYEQSYRGGVKVAAGDIAGVGRDFIITAPGAGGGPVVKTFDFYQVVGPPSVILNAANANNGASFPQPINSVGLNAFGSATPTQSFIAGDATQREGVNIAAGDVVGDGKAEIITGAATGPAIVSIYNGNTGGLISQFGVPYQQTSTGNTGTNANGLLGGTLPPTGLLLGVARPNTLIPSGSTGTTIDGTQVPQPNGNLDVASFATGGVMVATIDYDGDGKADIIAGAGPGNSPRVRVSKANGSALTDFLAFPANVLSGVFVG